VTYGLVIAIDKALTGQSRIAAVLDFRNLETFRAKNDYTV